MDGSCKSEIQIEYTRGRMAMKNVGDEQNETVKIWTGTIFEEVQYGVNHRSSCKWKRKEFAKSSNQEDNKSEATGI